MNSIWPPPEFVVYTQNPTRVRAIQFTKLTQRDVRAFLIVSGLDPEKDFRMDPYAQSLTIATDTGGSNRAAIGDWLICTEQGGILIADNEYFTTHYTPVSGPTHGPIPSRPRSNNPV
jgi:hypothetical protein